MASFTLGIVGSIYGGAPGAFIGAAIGSYIDAAFIAPALAPDAPAIEGPRIPDVSQQVFAPGSPITIPYGRQCMTAGALIWTSNLIETEHEEEIEGGKGGAGPGGEGGTVITYTYAVNLAVMVCEGPVHSVTRIWAANKLLYNNGSFSRADDIRIALGTQTQQPDSMLETAEGVGNVPAFRGRAVVYIDNLQLADFGNATPVFKFELKRAATSDTVRFIVADQCKRVGLVNGADFDVTCLPMWSVRGLPVANVTTPRGVFNVLQAVWPFDAVDTSGKLFFKDRNRLADAIILDTDTATVEPEDEIIPAEPQGRGDELEFPRQVTLKFFDINRDYEINAVDSPRLITRSENAIVFDTPLVLTPQEAKKATDNLSVQIWLARRTLSLQLPHKYLTLDAGDIFHIHRPDNTLSEPFRIIRLALRQNGIIELQAQPHVFRWGLGGAPGDSGTILSQVVPFTSDTIMQLFDVPLLTDFAVDTNSYYAAGYDAGNQNKWTGWSLYRALDGVTFTRQAQFQIGVAAGSTVTQLAHGATDYPDRKNTIRVNFASTGTPTATTNSNLQFGANPVICGASGRWEIMQFRDVSLVAGTTYDLSYLIRGIQGTEHNTGNHSAGDKFYIISPNNTKQVEQDLGLLNVPLSYKPVTFFQAVASATTETFTNTGEVLRPWSGVNGSAVKVSGDWTIAWTRRNRQFGGWNNGGDVPMTEASEHYEGDVIKVGGSVARTITVSTATITYTSAQQVTDFGSTQASVTVNTYQMSQRVGRGNVLQIAGQT